MTPFYHLKQILMWTAPLRSMCSISHLQCSPMLSSEDILASQGQNTEDAKDSIDDAHDPLPLITIRQTHSGFLDMKAYLLCFCAENGTEPPYDQLEQFETELLKAHNNSLTERFITDYAVKQ